MSEKCETALTVKENGIGYIVKPGDVESLRNIVLKFYKDRKLVKKMVKESIPDATESELKDCMRLNNLLPLMDAFYDVNGMKDKKDMSNLEKIKSAAKTRGKTIQESTG